MNINQKLQLVMELAIELRAEVSTISGHHSVWVNQETFDLLENKKIQEVSEAKDENGKGSGYFIAADVGGVQVRVYKMRRELTPEECVVAVKGGNADE